MQVTLLNQEFDLPRLAYSLYLLLSSFVIRPQHRAISLTTSVTFACGFRAKISGRFYNSRHLEDEVWFKIRTWESSLYRIKLDSRIFYSSLRPLSEPKLGVILVKKTYLFLKDNVSGSRFFRRDGICTSSPFFFDLGHLLVEVLVCDWL